MYRGSRFFYALEKTRGAKKHVTCLLAEDSAPLTDLVEMCERARDFYTSLFSPDPTDPCACRVLWEELPTVSVGDQDRLELPLTLAEFSEALRRMPTNKSPGMDGLTVEFYRAFCDILGPDLATVWAESLQGGVLPLSCRRAVFALLPKKGDRRDLRNWRPVSLLSMDYKIVANAISLWLGSVMADVIHPDQTYTVPGRSIFDNLFLVRDLLELGCRDGLSFALLSLDQEKAFGRVDHEYLLSTLQAFGFGPQFVSFLQVLYASAECLVRLNWTLTEPVSFGRGVRQGCPLSGQLYALAIEPFLCLLHRRLTGLVLWEPELRLVLSAYANDVLLVVQDPGDLARVEACQAIYSAASSAQVNWVKSSGLAVGDWRQLLCGNSAASPFPLKAMWLPQYPEQIENLQEQLRDKDKQLTNLKDRVKSLQTDSSNTDTALATLEEALSEKERIIERLKEQRERDDRERLEEIESFKKENKDLKEKVNALQAELTEKESNLIDLKEHASSLASTGLKRDSKLKSLEIAIEQKKEECSKLEAQLKKQAEQLFNQMYNPAHEAEEEARLNPEFADRMKQLDKEASYYREECGKAQAEVDRLLEILKEVENEKNDKDKKIAELERHTKDQNKKVANLKHNQQMEKKKNAQLLEEVRRREDNMTDNSQHLQLEELMNALEKTRQELDATKARLASTQQSLAEKEAHLANLRIERRKQLEEILEMKQEALLAAISEKDANIALLELSASKKKKTQEEVMALKREKDRLVHQLKQQVYRNRKQPLSMNISSICDADFITDIAAKYLGSSHDAHMSQTQNRMKLMADNYDDDHHHFHHHHHHHHHRSPGRTQHSNHRPSPDQDDEEGIWA
ncbi:unnamed protein product [Caretta caretta]